MRFEIHSDHPEADRLLKAALENYASYAQHHANQVRSGQVRPGETQEHRDHRAEILEARAAAASTMATQINKSPLGPPHKGETA